jgi:hypothetical protein
MSHGREAFDAMISSRQTDVAQFAGLLKRLSQVYRVNIDSFHLFFDPKGRTIAFNRKGSLFFNIAYAPTKTANARYYLELHAKEGLVTKDAPV